MLFNSWEFAVFFTLVYALYAFVGRRTQNALLLVASYAFYAWWDWRFLGLLWLSTIVDYSVGRRVSRLRAVGGGAARGRGWMWVSVAVNLGVLGFFKYWGFFVASTASALEAVGLSANLPVLEIVLPVGISFYTFQTMAYTIDVYRGRVDATRDPVVFALYVAFFPQLVAGPIERPDRLIPQLASRRRVDERMLASGALLVFLGLVRKVGIADVLAPAVDGIFARPGQASSADLGLGAVAFGLQIYGDFSGYSFIARGVSRLLGVELMQNFRRPYFAVNITDFWRRWHISLSSWLRDYLYIPLGGNRGPQWFVYRNLMLTMLLGGLWHGAAWTFVAWGAIHGIALSVHKAWSELRGADRKRDAVWTVATAPRLVASWALTMVVVFSAWVFFRAESFSDAGAVFSGILAFRGGIDLALAALVGAMIAWVLLIDAPMQRHADDAALLRWPWPLRGLLYAVFTLLMVVLERGGDVAFIYFQF
jgi:D-alanyl-lipoteichoic acid acyltransferase DltB (MBOAT superfamily)